VILHTNLGRAPLPETVVDEFRRTATQYSNLEYDLKGGARGKRDVHTGELLTRLTGAEAAIVVNNCAAAVLVTLAALARGGEVIVSRGELIEIGDGFRIPEIMEQSGAILREVGQPIARTSGIMKTPSTKRRACCSACTFEFQSHRFHR